MFRGHLWEQRIHLGHFSSVSGVLSNSLYSQDLVSFDVQSNVRLINNISNNIQSKMNPIEHIASEENLQGLRFYFQALCS